MTETRYVGKHRPHRIQHQLFEIPLKQSRERSCRLCRDALSRAYTQRLRDIEAGRIAPS